MSRERHLAAIMFTDIEGYTALMQKNEAEAIALREKHRTTFELTTEAFNGKIVQYFGDGTLSTFKSTVEAVDCAIELQQAFINDLKIPVRIGIHMGDIVQSKDDIIGDAVNIASRIESCAVSGSILISDKVHDQIRSHKHIKVDFLDAYELKNVDDVIPLFAIANEGLVVPKPEQVKGKLKNQPVVKKTKYSRKRLAIIGILALLITLFWGYKSNWFTVDVTLYDKSIAVLPFDNLSADESANLFGQGVTEHILSNLSKIKDLHVISRQSIMQYQDTDKTIPEIAKELGVSYILEGSVQKYGDEVRITAQLIDGKKDEHIWTENYDKTLTNMFQIQSEVSSEIAQALKLNLTFEEQQNLAVMPTESIEAYEKYLKGREEADKRTSESIAKSIQLFKEAITIDPNYALAYAEIAHSIYLETYYSGRNPEEASKLANEYLDNAEKISNKISRIYSVKGLINNIEGKHEAAEKAFKKAIELSPNDLTAHHQYSTYFYYTGQYEKQLEQAEIAYKLDPLSFSTANTYFTALMANFKYDEAEILMDRVAEKSNENNQFVINRSYFRLFMDKKDYKKAITPLQKLVKEQNVYNRFLGYCYVKTGDTAKAYAVIDSIIKIGHPAEKSQQLAVVYSALQETDSVLFYLDTIRNKQTRTLRREQDEFFSYLKDDPRFIEVLKSHGITTD